MDVVHDAFDLFADHCEADGECGVQASAPRRRTITTDSPSTSPSASFQGRGHRSGIEEISRIGKFSRKAFQNIQARVWRSSIHGLPPSHGD